MGRELIKGLNLKIPDVQAQHIQMLQVYKAIFVVLLEQVTIFSLLLCSYSLLSDHW